MIKIWTLKTKEQAMSKEREASYPQWISTAWVLSIIYERKPTPTSKNRSTMKRFGKKIATSKNFKGIFFRSLGSQISPNIGLRKCSKALSSSSKGHPETGRWGKESSPKDEQNFVDMRNFDLRNLLPIMSIYYTVFILGVLLIALSYFVVRCTSSCLVGLLPLGGLLCLPPWVDRGTNLRF
jgi:hypothetical protein